MVSVERASCFESCFRRSATTKARTMNDGESVSAGVRGKKGGEMRWGKKEGKRDAKQKERKERKTHEQARPRSW